MPERDDFRAHLQLDQTPTATKAQSFLDGSVHDTLLSSSRMARSRFASAQNPGDNLTYLPAAKTSPAHPKTLASAATARQVLPALHPTRDTSPHSDVYSSSSPEPSDHSGRPTLTNCQQRRRPRSSQSHSVFEAKNTNSGSPVVVRAMTLPLGMPRSTISSPGSPSHESLGKLSHSPRPRSTSPMSVSSLSSASSFSSRRSRHNSSMSPSLSSSLPIKRRRARTFTISANRPSSKPGPPPTLSGIGRKVADSLQLFRETSGSSGTTSTTIGSSVDPGLPEYVVNSAEVVCPGSVRPSGSLSAIKGNGIVRDVSEHDAGRVHGDDDPEEEIGGTVFVKRQEWPERETWAARRFASVATTAATSNAAGGNTAALDSSSLLHRDAGRTPGGVSSWQTDDTAWKYDGDRGRLMDREPGPLPNHNEERVEHKQFAYSRSGVSNDRSLSSASKSPIRTRSLRKSTHRPPPISTSSSIPKVPQINHDIAFTITPTISGEPPSSSANYPSVSSSRPTSGGLGSQQKLSPRSASGTHHLPHTSPHRIPIELPEPASLEHLPVTSSQLVSPAQAISRRPSSRVQRRSIPRAYHDRNELSESDWGDDSMSAISASATTLTTGSTYSESDDEDEYGGDDGEYDSFRDEFDDDDEDGDTYDRHLELDGRGRPQSVSVAARLFDTHSVMLEGAPPVQAESPLQNHHTLRDTAHPLQARRRGDPSRSGEGSETDEALEVQDSSFATIRKAQHARSKVARSPPATAVPLQHTISSSSAPSRLPPVPLKPFRNQVGGHSAIYKFTKRAVCKPLVSRENLFYEAVERTAPQLLDFIPRYLGVMLVNYRRTSRRPSHSSPHSLDAEKHSIASAAVSPDDMNQAEQTTQARPPIHKAATSVDVGNRDSGIVPKANRTGNASASLDPQLPSPQLPNPRHVFGRRRRCGRSANGYASDSDEESEEVPVVSLDRNQHIIPEWMLRGRPSRRRNSHSVAVLSPSSNMVSSQPSSPLARTATHSPQARPMKSQRLSTSSPEGAKLSDQKTDKSGESSSLANHSPCQRNPVLPRPAAFPLQNGRAPNPNFTDDKGAPDPSPLVPPWRHIKNGRPEDGTQSFGGYGYSPMDSRWFGTGSTVVNTKLKDHVFGAILKKFRKHHGMRLARHRSSGGTRTEDEGDRTRRSHTHTPAPATTHKTTLAPSGIAPIRSSPKSPTDDIVVAASPHPSSASGLSFEQTVVPEVPDSADSGFGCLLGLTPCFGDSLAPALRRTQSETAILQLGNALAHISSDVQEPMRGHDRQPKRCGDVIPQLPLDKIFKLHGDGDEVTPLAHGRTATDPSGTRSRERQENADVAAAPAPPFAELVNKHPPVFRPVTVSPAGIPASEPHDNAPSKPLSMMPQQNAAEVTRQEHFILMEDLTGRLKNSCVLDLKMGTRQYGIDATSAKKKSQRKKCDQTTSRTLGVRMCGMQVWNRVTQAYQTQDKYTGRGIRSDDFPAALAKFFNDGEHILIYHIPVILHKLYALAHIIYRLKGYRFYGCSLLFLYDGDQETQDGYRHALQENSSPVPHSKRSDSVGRRVSAAQGNERVKLRRTLSEDLYAGGTSSRHSRHGSGRARKRGEINIRIVDFAHTTTGEDFVVVPLDSKKGSTTTSSPVDEKGYQADVDFETGRIRARFPPHHPDQPDLGFLFGLKNIALSLERIWEDERAHRKVLARDGVVENVERLERLSMNSCGFFDNLCAHLTSESGWLSS